MPYFGRHRDASRHHTARDHRRPATTATWALLATVGLVAAASTALAPATDARVVTPVAALAQHVEPASAASVVTSGTVAGTVYEDYDANGTRDAGSTSANAASATDRGIAGAGVTVTDSSGATVGTATTDATGAFSVSVSGAASSAVRVEITPPAGFTAGPHGTDNGTTVQFVTLGSTAASDVEVGLVRQGDYSQDAPDILTVQQSAAIGAGSGSGPLDPSTQATLVKSGYDQRGAQNSTVITTEALASQTGSIWGVAQLDGHYAFTSAFLRRHARLGPGGLGAIYLTNLSSGSANATLAATVPNAGTDPRTNEDSYTFNDWFHDVSAYPEIGLEGLGGLAVTPNHQDLYVVNLQDRNLYEIPIDNSGATPTLGTPTSVGMPLNLPGAATGCANADVRPFGVDADNQSLYVTLTCVGPTTADLRGYVYRYDLSTGAFDSAPAFETALSGYARGQASRFCGTSCDADWQPWPTGNAATTWPITAGTTSDQSSVDIAEPQPLMSSIAFDSNGDMSIGITDRFAAQIGFEAGNLTTSGPGSGSTYQGYSAGDALRACVSGAVYVLESGGSCGSRTGYGTSQGSGANQGYGPGDGHFYDAHLQQAHDDVALGALLQVPGYGQILGTTFDANPLYADRTEGYRFWSNQDGATDDFHTLRDPVNSDGTGQQGSFGKAGGLGDLTALVQAAPIEIGNRVWEDTNGNGVQDAGEPGVAGVTVGLYTPTGTTPIATATTDSSGDYYFSNGAGSSTSSAVYGITGLTADTNYVVRLTGDEFASGGVLAGYDPTVAGAGSDNQLDSNGTRASATAPDDAPVTTGPDGTTDDSIDFGVVKPVTVGDFVWNDLNHDGIQESGEPGLPNVQVTISNASGGPVLEPDGTPLPSDTTTTDSTGHYSFSNLAPGTYTVTVTTPSGYYPTLAGQGSDTSLDSSTHSATTGPLTSGQSDDSLDFGFVAPASVGNFVWNDINRDGIQQINEPGIPNVVLTLTGPGGGSVTDINGQTVGP